MSAEGSSAPVRPARGRAGTRREALKSRARKNPASARVQVSEMQRARLLSAAVAVVDEQGYAHASVAHITARARVSRRTFYDLFENREDCLLAILEDTAERIAAELESFDPDALSWRERVCAGLWSILHFFDREPALARVCIVQGARGSQRTLERREEILARLADAIDEGRGESARAAQTPSLTAEGLVGAVLAIVHKRLLTREQEPLGDLLGELMSMIVLPYLGAAAARREHDRPAPAAAPRVRGRVADASATAGEDPLRDVPMRLTYRTARVLEVVAESPGASNRVVGEGAGIADQGQISKLLTRLERLGLLANTGEGHARGERNAWALTPLGARVTQRLSLGAGVQEAAR